jgi:general secretion pathway protein J
MSSCTPATPHRQRGFTLIELLVVMTMLTLIMVGLGQAFRSMGQTEVRIDERLQRSDQMRVVHHFLQSALGRLDATTFANPEVKGGKGVLFLADPQSISWVGIMPARPGVGGRHFFRLAVEDLQSGESALVLRYQVWTPLTTFPNWNLAETQVLVNRMTGLQIQAEGMPRQLSDAQADWPLGWQSGWPTAKELPQRVSLLIQDQQGPWPPITIPLFASVSSDPVFGGFVVGGGR